MTIFITGGTGFIGSYVVKKLLKEGHQIILFTRKSNVQIIKNDNLFVVTGALDSIENSISEIERYMPEVCIHLAWEDIPDFSYMKCKLNLNYGIRLLEVCKQIGIKKIIIAGSCWEYAQPVGIISEEWKLSDSSYFAAVKNSLKLLANAFCSENTIDLVWLRFFYVYGIGQKKSSLIPYIITKIKKGEQPVLKGAHNVNDFIYVEDVAEAVVLSMMLKGTDNIINIGSGKGYEVADIALLIAKKLQFNLDEKQFNTCKRSTYFWSDNSKAKKLLDWSPRISLERGIDKMLKSEVE